MKSSELKFRIPRYLGLAQSTSIDQKKIRLDFGYSTRLRKQMVTDESGLRLIRACLKPSTKKELRKLTGLTSREVNAALHELSSANIVQPVPNMQKKFQRYDRHLLFFDLQGADAIEAQNKVSKSKIALIGMGGIGSWISMGLIGGGFKELKLIDYDHVELSNLTRQILYSENDLGKSKTKVAAERLRERNSDTKVTSVEMQVSSAAELKKHLKGMSLVIVSADRPARIHDWVDEVCIELGIPYINCGYRDGSGIVGPMTIPQETSCYQCHKPKESRERVTANEQLSLTEEFESRYQAPSFGPLNAIVSSVGVLEAIKLITGIAPCRSRGVELEIDPMTFEIRETSYRRDENCWHCGTPK